MIMKGDVVVAISNSGETEEILRILPVVKRLGARLVSVAGNPSSTLARAGDVFLPVIIREEACPLGLAPTASTTATLALGDAMAVALLVERGFREEDFALFHPGGALGKKLLLRVEDLMHAGDAVPLVEAHVLMREALFVITAKGLGVVGVIDDAGALAGIITDGDLRRALERGVDIMSISAGELMTRNPKRIVASELAAKALNVMEDFAITSLFVVKDDRVTPIGIIHLHDLLKAGLA
jgi:arabinose-5-phosphate isomerase